VATTKDDTTQGAVAPKVQMPAIKPYPTVAPAITKAEGLKPDPKADALTSQYAQQLSKLLGVDIKPTSSTTVTNPDLGPQNGRAYVPYPGGAAYYRPGQDDPHTLVHELAHSYTLGQAAPTWIVEGLAEWAAMKIASPFSDPNVLQRFGEPGADPASGYAPSAGFIEWLDRSQPGAAKLLAAAMRDGYYSDKWFAARFGKSPGALMEEYDPTFDGMGGLASHTPADIREMPQYLTSQFTLSPEAENAARVVADYQAAVLGSTYGKGELWYSVSDFAMDVVDALHRGSTYLDDLEARTMRMTSGVS
jgi:hypothetical protein